MVEGDNRFLGKTNNGAVEQEGMPWLQRRLQTAYGIMPFVSGSENSNKPSKRRRRRKRGRVTVISSGVERLDPPPNARRSQ